MRKSHHISSLLSQPVPSWVIAPFARHKTLTMISSPPSSGKSALLMHLGLMASGGTAFLDYPKPAMARKVLFIGLDAPSYDYAAIARKLLTSIVGPDPTDFFNIPLDLDFWFTSEPIDILSPAFISLIEEVTTQEFIPSDEGGDVEHWLPELVIIDAFRCIHKSDENDSREMAKVMSALRTLAEAGPAIIFSHHESQSGSGRAIYSPRGSTVIPASTDMHLMLRSKKVPSEDLKRLDIKGHWTKGRGSELAEDFECSLMWDEGSMFIKGNEEEMLKRKERENKRAATTARLLKNLSKKEAYGYKDLMKLLKVNAKGLNALKDEGKVVQVEGGWKVI